uniref:Uncharacterized protein n=1 Tax=Rhizophora mucronata TaxID=61149 RepID=A0A2P2N0T4_RHIMU
MDSFMGLRLDPLRPLPHRILSTPL